jgi:hypothetical protein
MNRGTTTPSEPRLARTRGLVTGLRLPSLPGQVPGGGPLPEPAPHR